eukprot:TRINITY_DN5863_c0_g1_i1.p1 TRINITY_DN5863_c0_g1~~TRINITY_DN5863_c0_g1_i1.p1  ORF type:complete len:342 (-),score=18.37 TRINITY_DN5863_c0_g1_i1:96-1121(-)
MYSSYFWLSLWFLLNIALTLMNKAVFKIWRFPFPITLSLIHMLFTSIFSSLFLEYKDKFSAKVDRNFYIKIFLFSVLFCANILFGNYSLFLVHVSLVQITRSTIPGITMILSIFILHKRYSINYIQGIVLVVIGVGISSYGGTEVTAVGLIITLLVCFLSSLKGVASSALLEYKIEPIQFSQMMSISSMFQMLIFSYLSGELHEIMSTRKYHTWVYALILTVNGTLAFLLNLANFSFIKQSSALSLTVAGNMKHIATIALSFIFFESQVSHLALIGTFVAILGAVLYGITEVIFSFSLLNFHLLITFISNFISIRKKQSLKKVTTLSYKSFNNDFLCINYI